jgi:CheY-like chemotaxis protein
MAKEKLLYVDDEFVNLQLFKFNFKNDYELLLASSGLEALSMLEDNPDIKVIISDLKMPGLNGIELIKKIKEKDANKVCVLLTAYLESESIDEAVDKKLIFKYVVKPWKKAALFTSIQEAFSLASE